jgi:hypothetical protein
MSVCESISTCEYKKIDISEVIINMVTGKCIYHTGHYTQINDNIPGFAFPFGRLLGVW